METLFFHFSQIPYTWFKSYYVVWKQVICIISYPLPILFKSYYVVWKPGTGFELVSHHHPFKSYYVVWKRYGNREFPIFPARLNRTMQYGNYLSARVYFQKVHRFKSYYVVWKLFLWLRRFCCCFLFKSYYVVWKRTIQRTHNKKIKQFKSYYVVWKPKSVGRGAETWYRFKSYYVVWKLFGGKILGKNEIRLNRTMQYGNRIGQLL